MKGLHLALLFLAAASASAAATLPSTSVSATSVTIASWNMQWLDNQSRRPESLRTTEDYSAMAKVIDQLGADILTFQEVADIDSLNEVLNKVDRPHQYRIELSSRARHQKTQPNRAGKRSLRWQQYVGFAIKPHVRYVRSPDLVALDVTKRHYLRYGVDITLLDNKQRPSLRILAIHLKSGCAYSERLSGKTCKQLAKQFKVLARWVKQRYREGIPFMVVGDFNRRLNQAEDKLWHRLNDHSPAGLKLHRSTQAQINRCQVRAYNRQRQQWYTRRNRHFIDHLVIGPRAQKMAVAHSFQQQRFNSSHQVKYRLSDHCPIKMTINIDPV